mmetsp:Transcript_16196/g.54465  ORF Transcript_16196/g.54465 Transcript_16196/m.54465 type:complete len:214 (-) Transcript_16196:225-866(-)
MAGLDGATHMVRLRSWPAGAMPAGCRPSRIPIMKPLTTRPFLAMASSLSSRFLNRTCAQLLPACWCSSISPVDGWISARTAAKASGWNPNTVTHSGRESRTAPPSSSPVGESSAARPSAAREEAASSDAIAAAAAEEAWSSSTEEMGGGASRSPAGSSWPGGAREACREASGMRPEPLRAYPPGGSSPGVCWKEEAPEAACRWRRVKPVPPAP